MMQTMAQADAIEQFYGLLLDGPALAEPAAYRQRDHLRHQHVFQRAQLRQQVVKLENKTERLISQEIALLGRQIIDAFAIQKNAAIIGLVERAEHVQQRAFAAAGAADDAEKLAGEHVEIQPGQHRHLDGVLAIGLVNADRRHQGQIIAHHIHLQKINHKEHKEHKEEKQRKTLGAVSRFIKFLSIVIVFFVFSSLCSLCSLWLVWNYSYRKARTGCSSAARSAGNTLNSTAMATAPS